MQYIADIMTPGVSTIAPGDSIQQAARLMDELNVGSIPVCEGNRLVGVVTDRDITVRATSAGKLPGSTRVEEVMSASVNYCFADQEVNEVMAQMRDMQIRRMPVMDRGTGALVGIVALGDLATRHSSEVDRTLTDISTPSEPDRS
jgi:CBS domain-containing protein